VPETLGGAGVLIDDGDPAAWAEMLRLVAADAELRGRLVELGARRVRDFDGDRVLERWVRTLGSSSS
jgi:glycosyltransferase involved in cell wall biosynthesis